MWCRNATCPNCREELDWDALALLHRRKAKARRTRVLGSFVAKLTSTAQQAVSRTGQENAPPASQAQARTQAQAQALPRRPYAGRTALAVSAEVSHAAQWNRAAQAGRLSRIAHYA